MKRKLLLQITGILLISYVCSTYLFSSKKDISGFKATDLSEICIADNTGMTNNAPGFRAQMWDIVYAREVSGDFDSPFSMFEYKGKLYMASEKIPDGVNPVGTVYEYDVNDPSAPIRSLVISGITGNLHPTGFTTDGTYIYAVNGTDNIFVIDPETMSVVDYITASGLPETPDCIAYDKYKDGFWVTTFQRYTVYFLDKTGERIEGEQMTGNTADGGIYGLAYDDKTAGGPYLWVANGNFYMNYVNLSRFNLSTGEYSKEKDVTKSISILPNGWSCVAPIYIYGDLTRGKNILVGTVSVFMETPYYLYAFELDDYPLAASPAAATGFTVTPASSGGMSASLEWKNPTTTMAGNTLGSISNIKLYRDNELLETFNNPTPGAAMDYEDLLASSKLYTYKLVPENSSGTGMDVIVKTYIGQDIPLPVSNLTATGNNGNAVITWTAPSGGENGGYVDFANLRYRIERLPENMILATSHSGTSFTDNTITSLGNYSYIVTPRTAAGYGEPVTSNALPIGGTLSIPWKEDFDDTNAFQLWTIFDADGSATSNNWFHIAAGGHTTPGAVRIIQSRNIPTDSWLISPPLKLERNNKYRLNWYHMAGNADREYKVTLGTSPDANGQTTVLTTPTAGRYDPFTEEETLIEVNADNTYYIAWHIEGTSTGIWEPSLTIDDILLREIPEVDMVAISLAGPIMPSLERASNYQLTIRNRGKSAAGNFKVSLINSAGNELASVDYTGQLETDAYDTVTIPWTPIQTGEQVIRGRITITGEANEEDNTTEGFSVNVQEAGLLGIQIGEDELMGYIPFGLYYGSSFVQTIYFEDEIKDVGVIDSIAYFNSLRYGSLNNEHIKIYMALTDKTELDAWDMTNAILVFDGEYDFPGGENECMIQLQQPFSYTGGNLLITTYRPLSRHHNVYDYFKHSRTEDRPNRTRRFWDNYNDFSFDKEGVNTDELSNIILMMNTNVGRLTGVVKAQNGTVFPGITMTIKETNATIIAEENGNYEVLLPPGIYTIEVERLGYETLEQSVTIDKDDDLTLDFILVALEGIAIDGKVTDENSNGIENATVQIKGYDNYQVRTGTDGYFKIENVYINEEYSLTAERSGYVAHSSTLDVLEDDITLEDIILNSCGQPGIKNLNYTFKGVDGYSVVLDWQHPNAVEGKFPQALYAGNNMVVTTPAGASNGYDLSEVWDTDGYGFYANRSQEYAIADDFVLEEDAFVTDIDFYVYQSRATVPKVGAMYIRIYDASPMEGGNIIWGDMDTNVLEYQEFIGCYRVKEKSDFGLTDRTASIVRAKAKIRTELAAGTYWVEVQVESMDENGSLTVIPCSSKERRITGNSIISVSGQWQLIQLGAVSDYATQEMAFLVNGVAAGEDYPVNYKIYRDDQHMATLLHCEYSHTDIVPTYGNYVYEIAAIWANGCESERVVLPIEVQQDPCELPVTEFPYFESFERGFTNCWKQTILNGGYEWEITYGVNNGYGNPSYSHTGNFNIRFASTIGEGDAARLTTPVMDTRGLDTPYLSFYHAQAKWNNDKNEQDILRVYYRIGANGSLVKLAEYGQNITEWTRRIIELPVKSEELYIVFEAESGKGYGVIVDDVTISDDGCFPVNNFTLTQVGEAILLQWAEPGVPDLGTYTITRNGQVLAEGLAIDFYVDEDVEDGETYEYCISVDYTGKGKGCDMSESVCVNYTANIDECQSVKNLQAEFIEGGVYLTWDLEESDDIAQIVLARNYETYAVAPSYQTGYFDGDVEEGETYSYCIIVVYQNRTCSQSISVCLTDVIVGVKDETAEEEDIKIYPNPADKGYIKVEGRNIESISILNSVGQLIETIRYNEPGEKTVPLEKYAAGIYFMRIQATGRQVVTKKFIIN